MPATEQQLERKLQQFFAQLGAALNQGNPQKQRKVFEAFKRDVQKAAHHGVQSFFAYHAIATLSMDRSTRMKYFFHALEALETEIRRHPPQTIGDLWGREHAKAECLFAIGEEFAHQGDRGLAKRLYTRALSHAIKAEDYREKAGVDDSGLEGQIAHALLTLDLNG